ARPLVCALLPSVSENASAAASTAMTRATFLFDGSTWPPCDMITPPCCGQETASCLNRMTNSALGAFSRAAPFYARIFDPERPYRIERYGPRFRGARGTLPSFVIACKEDVHEVRRFPSPQHPLLGERSAGDRKILRGSAGAQEGLPPRLHVQRYLAL